MSRSSAKKATGARRGAPCANANALKHGKYTRERRALLAGIRAHIRRGRELSAAVMRALDTGCGDRGDASRATALASRRSR